MSFTRKDADGSLMRKREKGPLRIGTMQIAIRKEGLWRVWTGPTGWEYFHSVANAVIFAKALMAVADAQEQQQAENKQA